MTIDTIEDVSNIDAQRKKPDGETYPAAEVGWYLQRERETLGHSLMDVARELRVDPGFLHALEQGELHHQLGWTYVLSYVRSYSDFLGFEPAPVVRHYKKILAEDAHSPSGTDSDDAWPFSEVRARAAIATFAGVVGLMGVAGLVFQAEQPSAENVQKGAPSSTNSEIFVPQKNETSRNLNTPNVSPTPVSARTGSGIEESAVRINLLIDAKPDRTLPTVAMRDVPLPDDVSALRKSWAALKRLQDFNNARLAAVSEN